MATIRACSGSGPTPRNEDSTMATVHAVRDVTRESGLQDLPSLSNQISSCMFHPCPGHRQVALSFSFPSSLGEGVRAKLRAGASALTPAPSQGRGEMPLSSRTSWDRLL